MDLVGTHMRGNWALAAALAPLFLAVPAAANCAFGPFVEAYSPERCWIEDGAVSMKCDDKWDSGSCGMRLNAFDKKLGAGQWSMRIKAAPGSGAVTTFYLSNNGGMYDLSKPWNEVDFEIFGNTAKPGSSQVWTNFFTGHMDEHNAVITVPFDVSADFHTYTFDLSETTAKWLVDGVEYRSQDLGAFPDAQNTIRSWTFSPFVSLWGKNSKDPQLGVPEFRNLQGKLDLNGNPFPLIASFEKVWNPPVPTPTPLGTMEEEIDYVVTGKWFKTINGVGKAHECGRLCQAEPRCKCWSVVYPCDIVPGGACWLKGGLPTEKKPKQGVCSGFPTRDVGAAPDEKPAEKPAEPATPAEPAAPTPGVALAVKPSKGHDDASEPATPAPGAAPTEKPTEGGDDTSEPTTPAPGAAPAEKPAEGGDDTSEPATPAPGPAHEETPAPAHEATPAPAHEATPAPAHEATPAPAHEATPAPVHEETPAPVHEEAPAPVHEEAPAPVHEEAPTPSHEEAPAGDGDNATELIRKFELIDDANPVAAIAPGAASGLAVVVPAAAALATGLAAAVALVSGARRGRVQLLGMRFEGMRLEEFASPEEGRYEVAGFE